MLPWNMKRYRKTDKVAFPQMMATILINECMQQGTKTVAPWNYYSFLLTKLTKNSTSLFNQ